MTGLDGLLPSFFLISAVKADIAGAVVALGTIFFLFWLIPILGWFRTRPDPCPRCGAKDIRASKPDGIVDWFRISLNLYPYRCRVCRFRFVTRFPRERFREEAAARN